MDGRLYAIAKVQSDKNCPLMLALGRLWLSGSPNAYSHPRRRYHDTVMGTPVARSRSGV